MIDIQRLLLISDWLADDNELPSSGDAVCVMEAVEEIKALRDSLANAIKEADEWYDDSTGNEKIDSPEMNKARDLLTL